LKKRDIIIIGIQPWDIEIGSNCKNIALGFSEKNRVLFVNMPLDRKSALFNRNVSSVKKRLEVVNGKQNGLIQISESMWTLYPDCIMESINSLPDGKIYDYFNFINSKRFIRSIKKAITKLDFKDIILFNDSSMFIGYYFPELLSPALSIYYIRDNLVNNPYWRKHGVRMEPMLIKKYDMVLTNSEYYREYAAKYSDKSFMVGQGCDIKAFDEEIIKISSELNNIRRPIIGYIGHLTSRRLDIELIHYLALQNPNMSFVLIGKEDIVFQQSLLHQLKNVYFLGEKPENTIPSYLKGFDIAINPQIVNLATIGNYPRKVDEYLAMGKPVICMDTLAMKYFDGYAYLAKDKEEFNEYLILALEVNNETISDKRKEFAKSHSWEKCISIIEKRIAEVLVQKQTI